MIFSFCNNNLPTPRILIAIIISKMNDIQMNVKNIVPWPKMNSLIFSSLPKSCYFIHDFTKGSSVILKLDILWIKRIIVHEDAGIVSFSSKLWIFEITCSAK